MHTVTARQDNSHLITIKVDPTKLIKGHQPRQSGAGKHSDKRNRRTSKRSRAERHIGEW